ncbi:MAG: hypothetical protein AAB838_03340, partial [Patescibacteria group bacterium]
YKGIEFQLCSSMDDDQEFGGAFVLTNGVSPLILANLFLAGLSNHFLPGFSLKLDDDSVVRVF